MKKYNQLKTDIILDFYMDEICKIQGFKKSEALKKTRKREYSDARAMAMYLVKKQFPKANLKSISNYFNLKQHATTLHSINKIEVLRKSVQSIRRALEHCEKLNFVSEILKSNGFTNQQPTSYSKENSQHIVIIMLLANESTTCKFVIYKKFATDFPVKPERLYDIENIDIFDALIIAKNIDSNPLGILINSLKN
jgi:hypothetical protein